MRASSWCLLVCAVISVGCETGSERPTVVPGSDVSVAGDLPLFLPPDVPDVNDAGDADDADAASDITDADDADVADVADDAADADVPLTCPEGLTGCGGRCVSTAHDPQHCGRCGQRCPARQQCVEGRCTFACFAPLVGCPEMAPTACVDPRWDPANCGRCGRACGPEQQCVGGSCCAPGARVDRAVAQCAAPSACSETLVLRNGQSAAQGFQPGANGNLVRARLRMANPYAARGTAARLLLVAGTSETDLASGAFNLMTATVASTELLGGVAEGWYDALFAPPPAVMASQHYYLVLQLPTFTDCEAPCTVGADMMCNCPGVRWSLSTELPPRDGGTETDAAPGDGGADTNPRGRAFSCAAGCATWNLEAAPRAHVFEVYLSTACSM